VSRRTFAVEVAVYQDRDGLWRWVVRGRSRGVDGVELHRSRTGYRNRAVAVNLAEAFTGRALEDGLAS
jgi:hypothetical protein